MEVKVAAFGCPYELPFAVIISSGEAWGIVDAVRTALLDWSLKLEQAGIKGEDLSFSNEEREKAHGGSAILLNWPQLSGERNGRRIILMGRRI
ncbi:hypothetical protein [Tunturiibacter lichenicola]|uniref:AbiTii domain-containing protein n=1 Tax=Tunturiibacter lichenicola TaxID=2051959 RepID=UPI003D9AE37D